MGSACCCLRDEWEDYTNPNSHIYRNCICLNYFVQNFLHAVFFLFVKFYCVSSLTIWNFIAHQVFPAVTCFTFTQYSLRGAHWKNINVAWNSIIWGWRISWGCFVILWPWFSLVHYITSVVWYYENFDSFVVAFLFYVWVARLLMHFSDYGFKISKLLLFQLSFTNYLWVLQKWQWYG